ncbi:MAG: radical SAM protein [Desulfovibrionales bacterium]|nr:MAG: radical SAM protein [Desulfovibrionales bacterium]
MIKVFTTYRCNISCDYCFARETRSRHPHDISADDFDRLLGWSKKAGIQTIAFIGGEPTLHPELETMIKETKLRGLNIVVFTNCLFAEHIAKTLAEHASNIVVNYNHPRNYSDLQLSRIKANLRDLTALGGRVTFSKNFSPTNLDYDYLLEAIDDYGVRFVRYDISRPSGSASNNHYQLRDAKSVISHIVGFVKACESRDVRTGLDCSVRLCDLNEKDRRYLERVSSKFSGICQPSVDVHPDLSASYCLPMYDMKIDDITVFADRNSVLGHFAKLVRPVRHESVTSECLACKDFMLRCQGGCLALQSRHAPAAQPAILPRIVGPCTNRDSCR